MGRRGRGGGEKKKNFQIYAGGRGTSIGTKENLPENYEEDGGKENIPFPGRKKTGILPSFILGLNGLSEVEVIFVFLFSLFSRYHNHVLNELPSKLEAQLFGPTKNFLPFLLALQ